jgi:hypothetical protein
MDFGLVLRRPIETAALTAQVDSAEMRKSSAMAH